MKCLFSRLSKIIVKKGVLTCVLGVLVLYSITSCSKENTALQDSNYASLLESGNSQRQTTHRWFYFTEDGFKETDIPRNAPDTKRKPWTESIRITSSLHINNMAYLGVNKLGFIEVPHTFGFQENGIASKVSLITNSNIFSKGVLGEVYNVDAKPVLSFYTNSFFDNDETKKEGFDSTTPFLVSFDTETYEFLPLLSQEDLISFMHFEHENPDREQYALSEIRDIYYKEPLWTLLFKSFQESRTDFFALSFLPSSPLGEIENQSFVANTLTMDEYRVLSRPKPSSDLPRRLQELLEPIASSVSYYLDYSINNGSSNDQYEHIGSNAKPIQGYALSLDHCTLAIFEDGTIIFAGGLPSKEVLNEGKPLAFTLPDLGAGYLYGPTVLSGSTLIVSWEETSFFETGESGFLAVDMEQVLYQEGLGD